MRPFSSPAAPRGRRWPSDRRIAVPEIAGNFDDLTRTADWVPPAGLPAWDGVSVTDVKPKPAQISWLVARAVSLRAF